MMDKDIVYLAQTTDTIPDYVKVLEDMGRDVYILSYKKPVEHKNNIFFPDSTWSTGRNKLIEIVPKKYLYYVQIDDDVELYVRNKLLIKKKPWKTFDDFLLKYEPAIGCVYYEGRLKYKKIREIEEQTETTYRTECAMLAYHIDALDICFPMFTGFDHISIWWTEAIARITHKIAFQSCVLQDNNLTFINKGRRINCDRHRAPRFYSAIYKKSLLYKEDQDRAFLDPYQNDPPPPDYNGNIRYGPEGRFFEKGYCDGVYKKPYPGKYKKIVNNFKNRINKKHIFWKDHPLLKDE